jgi:hypothetical protein
MRYKPDWPAAAQHWSDLWHHRAARPVIAVTAPRDDPPPARLVPPPANREAAWLDPACLLPWVRNGMEATYFGGGAFPSPYLLGG